MKAVSIVFHFFQSFFYFYIHSIFNKKIDVLFYYPTHFNLSNKEVRSIQVMIDVCKEKKISFLLLEEPNYNSESLRNLNAIKFDFFLFDYFYSQKIYYKYFMRLSKRQNNRKNVVFYVCWSPKH